MVKGYIDGGETSRGAVVSEQPAEVKTSSAVVPMTVVEGSYNTSLGYQAGNYMISHSTFSGGTQNDTFIGASALTTPAARATAFLAKMPAFSTTLALTIATLAFRQAAPTRGARTTHFLEFLPAAKPRRVPGMYFSAIWQALTRRAQISYLYTIHLLHTPLSMGNSTPGR